MFYKQPTGVDHIWSDKSIFFLIIAPICLTPSHPPRAEEARTDEATMAIWMQSQPRIDTAHAAAECMQMQHYLFRLLLRAVHSGPKKGDD